MHPVMSTQLSLQSVTVSFDYRLVLDAVSCAVSPGSTTGVIGENGSGKSTLLRLLAGRLTADSGAVIATSDGGFGYLAQDVRLPPGATVGWVIDDALHDIRDIEKRLQVLSTVLDTPENLAEYGELQTAFELRGGYDADARAEQAMAGLGLAGFARRRKVRELSGGEGVRLQLAGILTAAPEVLLLDEPTNHLDVSAIEWLEAHLKMRRGTTVLVSHDREFLNRVCDDLLEVDGDLHTVTRYGGGYDAYLKTKAKERARWVQERTEWEAAVEAQRLSAATTARKVAPGRAPRDGAKAAYDFKAGRVQEAVESRVRNAQERLKRLLDDPVPEPPKPLRFQAIIAAPATNASTLLDADQVAVEGRLSPVSLAIPTGGRLLITGVNGAGKSTLLDVLAGTLQPTSGVVRRPARVGYLAQESVFANPSLTLAEAFAAGRPGQRERLNYHLMSLGLFRAEQLDVRVGDLSTGQQRRLGLARLLTMKVDLLLLDEPTNHLSLTLVEEVETALAVYPGGLIVVSHDRRLRKSWTGDVLELTPPAHGA